MFVQYVCPEAFFNESGEGGYVTRPAVLVKQNVNGTADLLVATTQGDGPLFSSFPTQSKPVPGGWMLIQNVSEGEGPHSYHA